MVARPTGGHWSPISPAFRSCLLEIDAYPDHTSPLYECSRVRRQEAPVFLLEPAGQLTIRTALPLAHTRFKAVFALGLGPALVVHKLRRNRVAAACIDEASSCYNDTASPLPTHAVQVKTLQGTGAKLLLLLLATNSWQILLRTRSRALLEATDPRDGKRPGNTKKQSHPLCMHTRAEPIILHASYAPAILSRWPSGSGEHRPTAATAPLSSQR